MLLQNIEKKTVWESVVMWKAIICPIDTRNSLEFVLKVDIKMILYLIYSSDDFMDPKLNLRIKHYILSPINWALSINIM